MGQVEELLHQVTLVEPSIYQSEILVGKLVSVNWRLCLCSLMQASLYFCN